MKSLKTFLSLAIAFILILALTVPALAGINFYDTHGIGTNEIIVRAFDESWGMTEATLTKAEDGWYYSEFDFDGHNLFVFTSPAKDEIFQYVWWHERGNRNDIWFIGDDTKEKSLGGNGETEERDAVQFATKEAAAAAIAALLPKPVDEPDDWAKETVNAAIALGVVPDNLKSNFKQELTRAEFAAVAVKMYETLTKTEITERGEFADTDDVNVQKLKGLGIVQGDGVNFDPNGSFNKEMSVTLMYNLLVKAGIELEAADPEFDDADAISSWAVEAIGALQKAGVVQGSGKNFDPQYKFDRQMGIVTAMNFLTFLMQNA